MPTVKSRKQASLRKLFQGLWPDLWECSEEGCGPGHEAAAAFLIGTEMKPSLFQAPHESPELHSNESTPPDNNVHQILQSRTGDCDGALFHVLKICKVDRLLSIVDQSKSWVEREHKRLF